MELQTLNNEVATKVERGDILHFEALLGEHPEAVFGDNVAMPLKHTFADGIYVREIFIPAGTVLTGKIHKHDHPNFLLKGTVKVVTEHGGVELLEAPLSMISLAGTKRVVFAISDTVWVTIHKNTTNTQDLAELEETIIAKDYDEYEMFKEGSKQLNQ